MEQPMGKNPATRKAVMPSDQTPIEGSSRFWQNPSLYHEKGSDAAARRDRSLPSRTKPHAVRFSPEKNLT